MEKVIKEVGGAEARELALRFLGQNIGEIKKLDADIISKNSTLRGNTLDVEKVINSIPIDHQSAPSNRIVEPTPITRTVPSIPVTIVSQPTVSSPKENSPQLEFAFEQISTKTVYDELLKIHKRIDSIQADIKKVLSLK